ncbi:cytochrome c-type biogenesis protein [Accumulibacter sp.]|uniref:cytochrome c-type biogenesis protein n=1 Tax=Accumulibacter sp. TaxID=2053492 RepID=UPI0025EC228F|nr:cytochrome c-type biogenesis protein [Accumulibacter sp.]MCM8595226.1 cytochrome c-type biogenesis protein CcmH [Accumulibacter sp.]MCM8626859.1 cytochrome c-type biogenesis protein CcmH [Accumulibacter sp.]MDS4049372.1 cytochrome c-type biogenesis protein [Accumulibacter sp.]
MSLRRLLPALLVGVTLLGSSALSAGEARSLAEDEATEQRLVAISSELRCLVCQNESLAGSQAELASDLRREIRTLIRDGRSDREIIDFMVSRYGDFVLYRPPLKATTVLLWFGPGILFVGGVASLVLYLRRRNRALGDSALSADERARASALLDAAGGPGSQPVTQQAPRE